MNCPSCGAHVPAQKRLWRNKPVTETTRLRKRVFMRAKRKGIRLDIYVRENLARYRAGKRCDREVLELPMPERRERAEDVRGRREFAERSA